MKVKQALSQERAAVIGDAKSALATKTNAEIDAWVEANVTNLAQARNLFKQILKIQRNILRHAARLRDA